MNNRKTSQGFANVSIKILKYVVMVVIIVVCATTAFNFGSKIFDSEGVDQAPGTDMTITVSEGTSIKSLGKTLKEYGIIMIDRMSEERKVEKEVTGYGSNYLAHAFRRIKE